MHLYYCFSFFFFFHISQRFQQGYKMEEDVRNEVALLVFTQMGFCVLGVFLNNVTFITLKDLPGMRASTYNVLLCHLTFVNLLVCTVVKPFSAIYVAYAHAIVSLSTLISMLDIQTVCRAYYKLLT